MPAADHGLYPSDSIFPGEFFPDAYVGSLLDSVLSFYEDTQAFIYDTTFTEGVLDDYGAWLNTDSENYLTALGLMFEQAFSLVAPQGDPDDPATFRAGYSTLLDVDRCPTWALPFLSQFNGTGVQPGTDLAQDANARQAIIAEQPSNRGTLSSMRTAVLNNLTGTSMQILERTNAAQGSDAYHVVILFNRNQCPDELALIMAVEMQKPAGIQITYVDTAGYTWIQATGTWAVDTMTWDQTLNIHP